MSRRVALAARLLTAATRAEERAYGFRERRVDVGDTDLAVLEAGPTDAPALVLVHGYTADRLCWTRFGRLLAADHRVVIPELAGHGTSGRGPGLGYSAPAQAARVAAVLDRLGIDTAHVAGNSMGGFVAATLAVQQPDRVRSLLLSDAVGVEAPEKSEVHLLLDQGRNPFLFTDPADFAAFYDMTMARPPFLPAFLRSAIAAEYVARRDLHAEVFTDFNGRDQLDDRLGEIRVPTLVMWGERDRIVHPSVARVWAEGIRGAGTVTYPDLGHMPMLEAPARTAADYRRFLADAGLEPA